MDSCLAQAMNGVLPKWGAQRSASGVRGTIDPISLIQLSLTILKPINTLVHVFYNDKNSSSKNKLSLAFKKAKESGI